MNTMKVLCKQGWLEADIRDGAAIFKGVPFAQPPVGDLRWREPQPPLPWGGVRPANTFSAMPVQSVGSPDSPMGQWYQSEDCLYLNLYVPEEGEKPYPVFVWFYGGSYQNGRADDPVFDGTALARKGILTVTVNYRVGLMGFFAHPDMRKESPYGTGGNFGLLDQIASLQWVHDNIEAFGGNPDRVTIAGQSAGSASVSNLMVSPLSMGLIHGAICESGDVFQPERDITLEEFEKDGEAAAKALGCESLDELRKIPVSDLVFERGNIVSRTTGRFCTPIIDGVVIPSAQGDRLLHNECAQIPVIIGTNADEGSRTAAQSYVERISERFGLDTDLYPMDNGIDAYANQLARDYWYARHLAWAKIRTEKYGLPTWQYVFSRAVGSRGANHGMEMPYVFDTLGTFANLGRELYTQEDEELRDVISSYWANFIRSGDPSGDCLPFWPRKNETSDTHMDLNIVCGMKEDLQRPTDFKVFPPVYEWMKRRSE